MKTSEMVLKLNTCFHLYKVSSLYHSLFMHKSFFHFLTINSMPPTLLFYCALSILGPQTPTFRLWFISCPSPAYQVISLPTFLHPHLNSIQSFLLLKEFFRSLPLISSCPKLPLPTFSPLPSVHCLTFIGLQSITFPYVMF